MRAALVLILAPWIAHSDDRVAIIVQQPEGSARTFSIESSRVYAVASEAAASQGWTVDPGASTVLRIAITPQFQRREDLFAFKIELSAGPLPSGRGLTSSEVIDIPWNDFSPLLSEVEDMTRSFAYKLKYRTTHQPH